MDHGLGNKIWYKPGAMTRIWWLNGASVMSAKWESSRLMAEKATPFNGWRGQMAVRDLVILRIWFIASGTFGPNDQN